MIKRLLRLAPILLLAACGADDPTGDNDFVALTGITITSENPKIAAGTSNQFTAMGDFSGEFTRDITDEVTWTFDGALAAMDPPEPGLAEATTAGNSNITATMDGVTGSLPFIVSTATIQSLAVTPAEASVPNGLSQQFTATGAFSGGGDAFSQNITRDVDWSVAPVDTGGATINDRGVATGSAVGKVTISAGFDSTNSEPAQLTVTEAIIQSITIEPGNPVLAAGEKQQFKATARMSAGDPTDVTSTVKWSSSNTGVATFSATVNGEATAVTAGTTTISALDAGSNLTGTTTLTVAALDSIEITPASSTISSTDPTVTLTATGRFANGTARDISSLVQWTSSNNNLAKIDSTGKVERITTATDTGTVTITATKDSRSDTATVDVRE